MVYQRVINLFKGKSSLVIRALLKDVHRPRSGYELAEDLCMTPQWVNRILASLEEQGFVQRSGRGVQAQSELVDPLALIKAWLVSYQIHFNRMNLYFVKEGDPLGRIQKITTRESYQWALTGYEAANQIKASVVDTPPMIYLFPEDRDYRVQKNKLENEYALIPVLKHANLIILEPLDHEVTFYDSRQENSLPLVSPIQLFLDLYHLDAGRDIIRNLKDYWEKNQLGFLCELV